MSEQLTQITQHPYYTSQQELETKLTELENSSEHPSENVMFYVERIRSVNQYVKYRLDSADPILLAKSQLDTLNAQTLQQTEQINSYLSNGTDQHIVSANNIANKLIINLANIPYARTTSDIEQMRESIVSFRRSVAQHFRNVQDDFNHFEARIAESKKGIEEVKSSVETQKQRIDSVIAEYQNQFSTAEENRRETFASSEEKRLNQFSDAESKRQKEYEDFLKSVRGAIGNEIGLRKQKMEEIVNRATLTSDELTKQLTEKAAIALTNLEESKQQAQELVGVIGNTGIIHGYQEVANKEGSIAKIWEILTVGAMGLLIGFGLYAFWLAHSENFDWHFLAARAMAVIPLGVFAAYAAHKAEQHRQIERTNRRMELELAAISPYLATLPNETQYEVKRLLAERFFATDGKKPEDIKFPAKADNSADVIKAALENLKLILETINKK